MINAAAIHLMINTLPPATSALTAVVLAVGMLWRSDDLKRFAMLLMVAVPLLIIHVYFSGHATVRAIGNLPGVSLELIGEHQEAVFWTWIAASVAGALALFALARYRRSSVPGWVVAGALVASLTTDVFLVRTAHLGGRIRHPEVRVMETHQDAESIRGSCLRSSFPALLVRGHTLALRFPAVELYRL
jgi:hypothetical protein